MHREARQKADTGGKTDLSRGSVSAEQGENKSTRTGIFYPLPWSVAAICDLSSGAKGLFAKLCFDAWERSWCRVGVGSLANSLGVDRGTVRDWAKELERCGLIRVKHERVCCCYFMNPKERGGAFIPLLVDVMERRDVGHAYKLILCSLSYKQGADDWCWPKQRKWAQELGMSMRTIQRELARAKAKGEIQIRLRRRNRKQGNKYALTCGAVLGGRTFGKNSHRTKSHHLDKKRKAKSYFKALRAKFHPGDLSASSSSDWFGPEAVYLKLVNAGIHEKVARPMAFEQLHPFESVVQAINNAQILRAAFWKRSLDAGMPRQKFSVPGYVVAALNGARREGKIVGTTRLFREAGAKLRALKMAKAISAKRKTLSVAEFEARRRKAIRSLGLPA